MGAALIALLLQPALVRPVSGDGPIPLISLRDGQGPWRGDQGRRIPVAREAKLKRGLVQPCGFPGLGRARAGTTTRTGSEIGGCKSHGPRANRHAARCRAGATCLKGPASILHWVMRTGRIPMYNLAARLATASDNSTPDRGNEAE